ncbi:aldo/keto reductase [Streptomyces sp. NPDC060209]|uniref:aldo/keto reductase n=1 Tax=Streptomyces sp. NPDC060209 TaxID=3347073 RepID=UPI0036680612
MSLAEGVGIIPWSPLQGGWPTGKYRRGMTAAEPGTREARYQRQLGREAWRERDDEETWRAVEAVVAVAEEAGRTPAQWPCAGCWGARASPHRSSVRARPRSRPTASAPRAGS